MEQGWLFDARPVERPTTRTVAAAIRSGGPGALVGALERADHVRYQEVTCRSALNHVEGMPFDWTLNPYRGCTHGCHYCFARRYQTQLELGPGDHFSSLIFVKTNFAEVLARELDHPSWSRALVAFGTATDPYQPIEGHYRITRRSLQALAAGRTPVGLVTKGPLIVRDCDVLQELDRTAGCTVYVSVPTVDENAWRALEPGTAPPLQRLRAVRQLTDAGIQAGVLMAPVVPGLTTQPARLVRTLRAIADHGARFVGANLLFLDGGTRSHFLDFLSREHPALVPRYERLYLGKRVPRLYAQAVQELIARLAEEAGVARGRSRERVDQGPSRAASSVQAGFAWGDDAVSAGREARQSAPRSAGGC
jgi:DNA repair photolyase